MAPEVKLELRRFQLFPESVLEKESQSCSTKSQYQKTIPQTVESVPNVESAQEYETQFIDRYNYPSVSKTENCQN